MTVIRQIVSKIIQTISILTIGAGFRKSRTNVHNMNDMSSTSKIILRLFLLNIFLVFCLIVSLTAMVLARETSHITTSLAITLITAVIAMITSWCLSK